MIIERIRQIIELKQISERQFCKEVGVANGFLSKVKDVGVSKVSKILYTYKDINPLWLLTGEGEMLKSSVDGESTSPAIIYKSDPRDAEILAANKETIETQRELISTLKQRISDLERSSSYSKTSGFHTVPSADTSNPSQTGAKAKRPNK